MKLVFSKNEDKEITVFSKDGEEKIKFNYINMVKNLIDVKELEDPEFDGEFSEPEQTSIFSMINHINAEVAEFYSEEEK